MNPNQDLNTLNTDNTPEPLTDTSPMPFGMHKGKKMMDVPASYLHWLWREDKQGNPCNPLVLDYISRSISALKEEYLDGIWT